MAAGVSKVPRNPCRQFFARRNGSLLFKLRSSYRWTAKYLRNTGPVAVIYGTSVVSLGVAELLYAHSATSEAFGQYAYYRQAVPLLVALGVLGIDQAICREAVGHTELWNWQREVPALVSRTTIASAVAAAASFYVLDLEAAYAAALVVATALVTVSEFSSAVLRAGDRFSLGAIAQQGYRISLAVLLLASLGLPLGERILPWTLALAPLPVAIGSFRSIRSPGPVSAITPGHRRSLKALGIGFAAVTISGGAIDWLDHALLAWRFGSFSSSGDYAATKLVIVFPFITIASFLGFSALPEVARRRLKFEGTHVTRMVVVCSAGAGAIALLVGAGVALFPNLLPTAPPLVSVIVLLIAGAGRLLYVIPSAVLGALGTGRYLYLLAGVSLLALVVEAIIIVAIPTSVNVITAGAIAVLAAVAIRLLGGCILMLRSIRPVRRF